MKVEIIPFKRNEYDRGSRKIVVDGAEWGSYRMEGHGSNGPSYHAEDHHGPVMVTKLIKRGQQWDTGGKPAEHTFRPKGRRDARWERKDQLPTNEQLRLEAVRLIEAKALRSPEARAAEIAADRARFKEARIASEKAETAALVDRAKDIVGQMQRGACGEHLVNQIVAAMRWAQTQ